jgi:hypothetical protein
MDLVTFSDNTQKPEVKGKKIHPDLMQCGQTNELGSCLSIPPFAATI